MKAIRYPRFGSPELVQLDEVPPPRPGPGEVLVDVVASSVNPADWKIGAGALKGIIEYQPPFIPGLDFAGMVRELGAGVTGLEVGDRVYGATTINRSGAFAERLVAPASVMAKAPRSVPLTQAAAVPLAALTAWGALFLPDHANLQAGQRVLILGGAGGTGAFATQLAHWRKAKVIATASARNLDFLRSLGADETIDYAAPLAPNHEPVDAVIDLVGGAEMQACYIPLIRPGGIMTSAVSLPDAALAQHHNVRASFISGHRDGGVLAQLAGLIDAGHIKIVVSAEYSLANAGEALAENRKGHTRGKIVISVRAEDSVDLES